MHQDMYYQREKKIAIVSAWISVLFGVLSLALFTFGELFQGLSPIKGGSLGIAAPLLFSLYGICLLSLVHTKLIKAVKGIAAFALILSLLATFSMYIPSNVPMGMLIKKVMQPHLFWGSSISFCLISFVFIFWPAQRWTSLKSSLHILMLCIVIQMSLDMGAIYLLPSTEGAILTPRSIHPAIALFQMIQSIGLISWNLYQDGINKVRLKKWFIPLFSLGIILFHIIVLQGLLYEQKKRLQQDIDIKAQSIKVELEEKLNSIGTDLTNFSSQIQESQKTSESSFLHAANLLLREEPSLQAVAITNPDFSLQYIEGRRTAVDTELFLSFFEKNFSQRNSTSNSISFYSPASQNLYIMSPMYVQGIFKGGSVFEISLSRCIALLDSLRGLEGYGVFVRCNTSPAFSTTNISPPTLTDLKSSTSFKSFDVTFDVSVQVSKGFFIMNLVNSLIFTIIVGSTLGAIAIGALFYLFRALKDKILFSKNITDQLALSDAVLRKLNEAMSIQEAYEKLLELLNESGGWTLLLHWKLDSKEQRIYVEHASSLSNDSYASTKAAARSLPLDKFPLLYQCLTQQESLWDRDISLATDDLSVAANSEGLKGSFMVPLYEKKKVIGAIQILRPQSIDSEPDPLWMETINKIAYEMSRFIQRTKSSLVDREFNLLIKQSRDAIMRVSSDQKILSWNLGAERIYGWSADEIIGKELDKIFLKDDANTIKELIFNEQSVEHLKAQYMKKDGSLLWTDSSLSPLYDDRGSLLGGSMIVRDITKEKLALDALKESEEKFRVFVDSTRSWIWEIDIQGHFTFSNPAVTRMLGYGISEILSKHWLSFALDQKKLQVQWDDHLKKIHGWKQRLWQAITKKGTAIWLESTADPIYDSMGRWTGFRGVERDVTEEVNMSRSKSEFISMVSHELRSPLTSIMGAIGLLKQTPSLDAHSLELISLADRNSRRLLNLINDILDIEKLTLGKMQFHFKECHLKSIIEEAVKVAQLEARECQVTIVEENISDTSVVFVDYDRLLQVILNLLSNAMKFSDKDSEIQISTTTKNNLVRVSIKDRGPGIPYDMQDKIFQRFVQGIPGDTKVKGTGLGLSICKEIIEKMKGSIGFISKPKQGSEFFFDLPLLKGKIP